MVLVDFARSALRFLTQRHRDTEAQRKIWKVLGDARMMKSNRVMWCVAGMFGVWLLCAVFGLMGQRTLFLWEGEDLLSDFWMPCMCLEQGYVGHPEKYVGMRDAKTGDPIEIDERDVVLSRWYTDGERTMYVTGHMDKVYPRVGLLPFALFPASWGGAYAWGVLAGAFFLAVLCGVAKSWKPLALCMTMPFLFALERGNPIWLSAAFVAVFLAWWDDECEWKAMVAAGCLAVAAALKIAPAVLGVLYFTKWRWKPVMFSAGLAAVFFFVPWMFDKDGFAALGVMLQNAKDHAQFVLRTTDFGLVELWRTARIVPGLSVDEPWPGMMVVARISQALGFAALVLGAKRRDYVLLVGGMILAAGNMYYYAVLYLVAVFVLEYLSSSPGTNHQSPSTNHLSLLLWLAILSPLQVVVMGHSANQVICNLAMMGLMGVRAWRELSGYRVIELSGCGIGRVCALRA